MRNPLNLVNENRPSEHPRLRGVLFSALFVGFLWVSSILLALVGILVLNAVGKYVVYTASGLGQLSGSLLSVTGVLIVILLAVHNSIRDQTLENRFAHFAD